MEAFSAFKKDWIEFVNLTQSLQVTVKRVDFAYQSFFKGLRGKPNLKPLQCTDAITQLHKEEQRISQVKASIASVMNP
jgi:hypothetical protein